MTRSSLLSRISSVQGLNPTITACIVFGVAATQWLPHLSRSLLLDETLTYWVVKDGLIETLDRGVHFQSQAAYYALIWLWTQLAGTGEVALRLPSLLATLGSCIALAWLGRRLTGDRETGLLAVVVFVSCTDAFREAIDARAYMISLFVLLVLTLGLFRWIEEGRWRDVWICGLLGALLPHFHLFFALVYPAFGLYAGLRWPRGRANLPAQLGVFSLLLLFGALLFVPAASTLLSYGSSYSFAMRPDGGLFIGMLVWTAPVAGLLTGLCIAGIQHRRSPADPISQAAAPPLPRDASWLLTVWIFVPMSTLFAFSTLTDLSVFYARHLMEVVPAVCLVYAMALRGIATGPARVVAAILIAITSFALNQRPPDDFRSAARAVNQFVAGDDSVPILFASGLIESEYESIFRDEAFHDYLLAPSSYYEMEGLVQPAPRRFHGQPLAIEIVDPVLESRQRFAAVEWYTNGARIMPWLVQRAEAAGYRVERRGFGGVRVALFRSGR